MNKKKIKPRGLFGGLTRRQKALCKKYHVKIQASLGTDIDDFGEEESITRFSDIYFDDIEDLATQMMHKYHNWMDFISKFKNQNGKTLRNEPRLSIFFTSDAPGINYNKGASEVEKDYDEYETLFSPTNLESTEQNLMKLCRKKYDEMREKILLSRQGNIQ